MDGLLLRGICKTLSPSFALREISLAIPAGQLYTLLGPSGAGKTTLLRIIAGLENADQGEIELAGRMVHHLPPHQRQVAMVFQQHPLFAHLEVEDNIAFPLKRRGLSRQQRRPLVEEALALCRLEALRHRFPATLSGGEQQRVAFARAMVRRPAIFLLDEPLAHLDSPLRHDLLLDLAQLQRRLATTMLYVTHDQQAAFVLGQGMGILVDGRLEQSGTPSDIYYRPANPTVAHFAGHPPMNLLRGEGRDGAFWLCDPASPTVPPISLGSCLWQGKGILALRAEHIALASQGPLAVVEAIHSWGPCDTLYLRLHSQPLTAQIPGHQNLQMGQSVALRLALEQAQFFPLL